LKGQKARAHFAVGKRVEYLVPVKKSRAKAKGDGGGGQAQPCGLWWEVEVQERRWNARTHKEEAKVWYVNKDGKAQKQQSPGWVPITIFPVLNEVVLLRRQPMEVKREQQAEAQRRREEEAEEAEAAAEEAAELKKLAKSQAKQAASSQAVTHRLENLQREHDERSRAPTPVRGRGPASKERPTTMAEAAREDIKRVPKVLEQMVTADLKSNMPGNREAHSTSTTYALIVVQHNPMVHQGQGGRPSNAQKAAPTTVDGCKITAYLPDKSPLDANDISEAWRHIAGGAAPSGFQINGPVTLLNSSEGVSAHVAQGRRIRGVESAAEQDVRVQSLQDKEPSVQAHQDRTVMSP